MKRLFLAALLVAPFAAFAEEPATIILPTPVVSAIAQYLGQRPYAEVAAMISALQGCVAVQMPNPRGATVSHGECPPVTAAMTTKAPAP
jgi:Na+/H+ antiporter NhaD/arsenite permease-like protein